MLDKSAGLPTQIRQLEKRLKEMDASKVKPALVKEITDTINNLKNMLKEKVEKREQRKKDKEQKAAETSTQDVTVEADAITDKVEHDPKIAPGIITPDSLKEKEKIVEKVEHSPEVAPHIISEKEPKAELHKLSIDSKVEPIRGGNGSWGLVMREADTNGDPLCYVKWMEGDLKDKHGMGGYYPNDLKLKAEEAPLTPEHPCPCWEDASVYCPKCKSNKTSDLKSNYEDMLKDLKDEHKNALDRHNHTEIARLDQKIKELEVKIQEKFGNEKEVIGLNALMECDNCHAPMGPMTPSHLENLPDGEQKWNCNKKEAGAQNDKEHLTVMDHTPPRANTTMDEGGKDTHDEFQDEWAEPARDVESARGVPGSLFNAETAQSVADRLNSEIKAPYVNAKISTLGGPENVGIYLTVSADPKENWANGILHNSRYGMFAIRNDGEIEHHAGSFNRINEPRMNFRKRNVKNVDQLIQVINQHLDQVNATQAAPKTSSLKEALTKRYALYIDGKLAIRTMTRAKAEQIAKTKFPKQYSEGKYEIKEDEYKTASSDTPVTAATKLSVFNREWIATPVTTSKKFGGYDISDSSGKKILNLNSTNSQPFTKDQLEFALKCELTHGYKQATLTERIAMLSKGTKVYVLAQDKAQKRVKIASLEQSVRAWVPEAKIKLIALESQAVQHNGHSDKVLGQTSTQTLLDCIEGGPVWVSSTELLDSNRPPATPESLNEDLGKDSAQSFQPGTKARISSGSGVDSDKIVTIVDRSLVKTDGRGIPTNVSGAYKPVDWNREVAFQYEDGTIGTMFKNRLMPVEQTLESEVKCPKCKGVGIPGHGSCPECGGYATEMKERKQSAKDCPDCHGTFQGAEGDACPTCGRFAVTALKTALPPVINNERAYLNNPVAKQAAGCDQCNAAMINGVFCHERGCPNAHKEWEQEQEFGNFLEGSLKLESHIRHEDGKWVVWNHDYTKRLGTYGTKEEASKRLRQIEYFKHQGSLRPFSKKEAESDTHKLNRLRLTIEKLNPISDMREYTNLLREIDELTHKSNKKAEVLTDPYQSLTNHITDMKSRMSQVQERLQSSPLPKQAGEEDNSSVDLPELFEDLSMGINLLETKLGGDDIDPELHSNVESLENLLWELEEHCGITPKLDEHEKAEPEHKEIVEEVEKEAGVDMTQSASCKEGKHKECRNMICQCPHHFKKEAASTTTVTTYPAAPTAPTAPTTPQTDDAPSNAPDDASPSCALCGGLTFADYAGYQNHMEYTHASDTAPTNPVQKLQPTNVTSKKVADLEFHPTSPELRKAITLLHSLDEDQLMDRGYIIGLLSAKGMSEAAELINKMSQGELEDFIVNNLEKEADVVTDETIEEGTGTPPATPAATTTTPTIQNVRPTDNNNLEIAVQKPQSPPSPGQIWSFDPVNKVYVSMPDPANPHKTI